MPHRDFDAEQAERARESDPITFTLGGVEFEAVSVLPLGAIMDLAAAPDETQDIAGALEAFVAFFEEVVVPDQQSQAAAAVRRSDYHARHDVTAWLGEQYAGRPTVPSSGSAVSPPPDGRDSSSERSDTATAA